MSAIAIIPARGGSKRIPRKNIREFAGRPVIAYSIDAALSSGLFQEVMVSTDDDEIASTSKRLGASVPFLRSTKNSDDFAGSGDVALEVLTEYHARKMAFDYACCIYATAPLISDDRLREGFELLKTSAFDAVFAVSEFSSPIWRSYELNDKASVKMNFPEHEKKRSQDLPKAYYDAGQFYWFRVENFLRLENKNVFGVNKGAIILSELEVQDIDNIADWRIAEIKYAYQKENSADGHR